MVITKIICGLLSGAERGALEAALLCGFPHEDASRSSGRDRRVMRGHLWGDGFGDQPKRTQANVVYADATLIFTVGPARGGALRAIHYAVRHGKPWRHIDLRQAPRHVLVRELLDWLQSHDPKGPPQLLPAQGSLYVTGSREKSAPRIGDYVFAIMLEIFRCQTRPHGGTLRQGLTDSADLAGATH